MGLAERRAVQTAKETDFKTFEDNIKKICGYDMKLTFDWAAVEANPECAYICTNKKYNYFMFDKVTEALTKICGDEMGKTALREKVKELNMVPTTGDISFAGGVFTVHNDLTGQGAWGADQIQEKIEKEL